MSVVKEIEYRAVVTVTRVAVAVDNYNGTRTRTEGNENVLEVQVPGKTLELLRDRVTNVLNAGLGLDAAV